MAYHLRLFWKDRNYNNRSEAQLISLKKHKYWKTKRNLLNRKLGGFLLFAIMIVAVGTSPVFASPAVLMNATGSTPTASSAASSTEISVTTDKTSYNDGDKITISGVTQDYVSGTPITVIIQSPIGNIVKIDQVDLGSDRTFTTTLTAAGSLWHEAGAYTVKVQYGSASKSASTTFQFAGSAGAGPSAPSIKIDGTDFSVKYSITNGKVLGMKVDTNSKSLIVSIQTTGDGVLTVTLPRGLIDAKTGSTDAPFVVMNDGQENTFEETSTTTTDRTLSIPFTNGTTQVEIIGTFAIPEFGTVATMILVIAIVSVIAISSKTGMRFIPKY